MQDRHGQNDKINHNVKVCASSDPMSQEILDREQAAYPTGWISDVRMEPEAVLGADGPGLADTEESAGVEDAWLAFPPSHGDAGVSVLGISVCAVDLATESASVDCSASGVAAVFFVVAGLIGLISGWTSADRNQER